MTLSNTINGEEKECIEELRMRLKNVLPSHLYDDTDLFYRFLKARDFDVNKAEAMLRKHITWRKTYQIDTMLETFKPKEVFVKYIKPGFIGFDKDGDPVIYAPAGKLETRDVLKCMKMNDYMKHFLYCGEELLQMFKREYERTGKNPNQISLILDLDKLTFSNATYRGSADVFLYLSHLMQDNHPERMKATYVINAPAYYVFIYSVLRKVMSSAMTQKIHVQGQSGWKETLLEKIEVNVLPAFLGGNRTDPDGNPLCTSFISHGGKFPPEFYLTSEERWFKDITSIKTMFVPASTKSKVPVEVKQPGSLIHWEFETKNKDIGFGLFYKDLEEEVELIPIHRYATPDGTVTDSYKTKLVGTYVIVFDNSYSWLSSKEVRYTIKVSSPDVTM